MNNDYLKMAEALFEAVVGKDGQGYEHAISVLEDAGFKRKDIELLFNGEQDEEDNEDL